MKKLFKSAVLIALSVFTLSSCMDNNEVQDDSDTYLKKEKVIDSLLAAQKIQIEAFKNANYPNAVEDSVTISLPYLGKKIKRGIWYEVVSEPTDQSYNYEGQVLSNYYGYYFSPILPKVKLKYTATLLGSTAPVQKDLEGSTYDLAVLSNSTNSKIFNSAWYYSFIPYYIKYNGANQPVGGLTEKGLKKGSKLRVITPSYWAFGGTKVDDIPADSPLVYEFEVLEIQ